MKQQLLTPEDLAERWQVATKTLSKWRSEGTGPQYIKIGSRVRYNASTINAYEEKSVAA